MGENMEQLELSCIAHGNVKQYTCFRDHSAFVKNLNLYLPYDPAVLFLDTHPRNVCLQRRLLFTETSFIEAKNWKQPKCPSTGKWIANCGVFMQWNTAQKQKELRTCRETWQNLRNHMLSKRSQKQEYTPYCSIHLTFLNR